MKMDIRQDPLMHELLSLMHEFERLAKLAPTKLSEKWLRRGDNDRSFMPFWTDILASTTTCIERLEHALEDNDNFSLSNIDRKLEYFRAFHRPISDWGVDWTAYELEIKNCLRNMFLKTREIDKKYVLGQEKW